MPASGIVETVFAALGREHLADEPGRTPREYHQELARVAPVADTPFADQVTSIVGNLPDSIAESSPTDSPTAQAAYVIAVYMLAPIAIIVRNQDQRSRDYANIKDVYRPGHADYTFDAKFGRRDYRGGGRSSARETVARVAAGAVARRVLDHVLGSGGVAIRAGLVEMGGDPNKEPPFFFQKNPDNLVVGGGDFDVVEARVLRRPEDEVQRFHPDDAEALLPGGDERPRIGPGDADLDVSGIVDAKGDFVILHIGDSAEQAAVRQNAIVLLEKRR